MEQRKKKRKKKKTKLLPEEIERRSHRREIRAVFAKAGFLKVASVSDTVFTFKGRTGDVDDVFIYENVVVLAEYTCSKSDGISTHLLKKKVLFDHILNNQSDFIDFFATNFPTFEAAKGNYYDVPEFKVAIVYCAKNEINQDLKNQLPRVIYLDYPIVKYFKSITDAIRLSSKYEVLKFLRLNQKDVGKPSTTTGKLDIQGSILPETHSNFDKGYKVVSFYIDPEALLKKSYVLRKDSWRDEGGLYQRMIAKSKIRAIRKYLYTHKRVFINNIIVTLPSQTKLIDENGDTVNPSIIHKTVPVTIQIPDGFNVIGLIDGQHRVFAYHEGGEHEAEIKKLREKQNLLATGIIYPKDVNESEKSKFEAKLFLEINSNQTNAKSGLKQAIELILNPFSSESIARAVVYKLNSKGPLQDKFERPFFEKDKIRITSIVSYGLKPIVKLSGTDSLFYVWKEKNKALLLNGNDHEMLDKYVTFCVEELSKFFSAVREIVGSNRWTADDEIKNKVLSTTTINGFIGCLRRIIDNGKVGRREFYLEHLKSINSFNFSSYKSSQYGQMSIDLYTKYFEAST